MNDIFKILLDDLKRASVLLIILTVITGGLYPFALTLVSQILFNAKANGSLVYLDGNPIGSQLIGQEFTDPRYFWGRPSGTNLAAYNASDSNGASVYAADPTYLTQIRLRLDRLKNTNSDHLLIPIDLITQSGSGLDPEISVNAAMYQLPRVANARSLNINVVMTLIQNQIIYRTLGVLGEPRINVLSLNLALDGLQKEQTNRMR